MYSCAKFQVFFEELRILGPNFTYSTLSGGVLGQTQLENNLF